MSFRGTFGSARPALGDTRDASVPVERAALPIVLYTPESQILHPTALVKGMARDLLAARELAWRLFIRNISARYRQTALGYVWALLPPVVAAGVFVFLKESRVFAIGETVVPYVVFVVVGVVLWQTFVDALNAPLRVVAQSKAMLTKINFPREALLLAAAAEVLFNGAVRAVLIIGVLAWHGLTPPPEALLVPFGVLAIIALGMAIGTLLVPVGLLFQDVEQGLTIAVSIWLFATPVFYPAPQSRPASLLMTLNPIAPVLDTTRAWLLRGSAEHLTEASCVVAITITALLAGWFLYRLALPILIERIGA